MDPPPQQQQQQPGGAAEKKKDDDEKKDEARRHTLCPQHPHICVRQLFVEAILAVCLYIAIALYTDGSLPSLDSCAVWVGGFIAMGVLLQAFRVSYQSQMERVVGFALANKLWAILQPVATV